MSGRFPGPQDELMKLDAGGVKNASGNGAAIDLGAGFEPGFGGKPFQAFVPIAAADFASADESYKFKLQHSADGAAWADCSAERAVAASDVGDAISIGAFVQARRVRLVWTIAGTTPSVTTGAVYLSPFVNV